MHEFDENMVVPMDFSGDGEMSKTVTESGAKDEDDSFAFKNESSQSEIKMKRVREKDMRALKVEAEKSKAEKVEPDSNNVL